MADVNACLEAAAAEPKSLANVQDDSTPLDSTPQSNSEKNYQNSIGSTIIHSNMVSSPNHPIFTTDLVPWLMVKQRALDMLSLLFEHGCLDITPSLDFSSIEEYAIHFGGFGLIHQGRLRDGTPVAIKILAQGKDGIGGANNKIEKRAAREVYNWSKSMHPNVVPLLGVTHNRGRILMVSPWMDCGTLPNHVSHCPDVNRFELTCQVAEGLAYMHDVGMVHGDIKGSNILVSRDGRAMLTDFGITQAVLHVGRWVKSVIILNCGLFITAIAWQAYEILTGAVPRSMEADVYALGMTVL
ncbi:hypothetical protein FRC07_006826, partial [Ceratobasidium sp. 392]